LCNPSKTASGKNKQNKPKIKVGIEVGNLSELKS
jgi:hypothetical protein